VHQFPFRAFYSASGNVLGQRKHLQFIQARNDKQIFTHCDAATPDSAIGIIFEKLCRNVNRQQHQRRQIHVDCARNLKKVSWSGQKSSTASDGCHPCHLAQRHGRHGDGEKLHSRAISHRKTKAWDRGERNGTKVKLGNRN
jgi:hypothetical protein